MTAEVSKVKLRSIDYLTPEQLQRKREVDRRSQRQARARTRAYIAELEQRVRDFEARIHTLEQEFSTFVSSCKCKREPQECVTLPRNESTWEDTTHASILANVEQSQSMLRTEQWIDQGSGLDISQLMSIDSTTQATAQGLPLPAWSAGSPSVASIPVHSLPDPPVWQALPKHTPPTSPTCALDIVMTNLIQNRRAYEASGGNDQEFRKRAFPSIQSLLNPTYDAVKAPVTSTIVNNIIHVMTVPTLPEQIAILYVMSSVVRWQISPTEANYDKMPEWLRPTPSQLFTPHPPWIDMFIWPKARERLCRQEKYHSKHGLMSKLCNESLSINWPHQPSDMILQVGDDTILNPIFERHIKKIENWTVSASVLEK
ncbi:uncharacterized protein PV09_05294 [Verruconis gallopava]|uniref:BZIP domain-containing protein n=1 Tax=Verruconis gallopava TaxID=253628 RepID=A0A0D2A9Y7_9PEZI|nr:uncharacterized protein PV09_05294 [Verruconis gallopava]KIW03533.1 hypothetical protein PV09_05294 [Verruconis gallopava]